MHTPRPWPMLLAAAFLCSLLTLSHGAFTLSTSYGGDFIQQDGSGTWCYYPKAIRTNSVYAACVGTRAEFAAVMEAQLKTTNTSINYFNAALERIGGPEWPVDDTAGKIYLCASGRAGDGSYQTICSQSRRDNVLSSGLNCKIQGAQQRVADKCYTPGLSAPVDLGDVAGSGGGAGGGGGNGGGGGSGSGNPSSAFPGSGGEPTRSVAIAALVFGVFTTLYLA